MPDEARGTFAVADRDGLHARPCARIAKTAAKFKKCAVTLHFDGRSAKATSVFELLGLVAAGGAVIEVRAVGKDAAACVAAIGAQLANGD